MDPMASQVAIAAQDVSLPRTDLGVRPEGLDEFIHELRQPLSVIDSLAYYLELTSPNDEFRTHLQKIQAMVFEANSILERARVGGREL